MTSFAEVDIPSDDDEMYDDDNEGNTDFPDEAPVSSVDAEKATADLEELVRFVASRLVHNPDDIVVESELRSGTVYVSLRVPEEEMGRVIGREGRTAKAIRTLVSIAGSRHNVHARLDIDG